MTIGRRDCVLLVEDDANVIEMVHSGLEDLGVCAEAACTLAQATERIRTRAYDAVILDLGLPDGNGLDFAAALRDNGMDVPILILTARAELPDRLAGFARGADDYVCKPFAPEELAARVRALLRRTRAEDSRYLRYGGCTLDLMRRGVTSGEKTISLSDREASLLAYFMQHAEETLPREQLAQEVFGVPADTDTGVINVYVNYLRNKLEHGLGVARLIHTIRGTGYILSLSEPGEPRIEM